MWKINDNVSQIMDDGTYYENGWSPSTTWYLTDLFDDLAAGLPIPGSGSGAQSQTKSISLKVTFNEDGIILKDTGFIVATAPQYLYGDANSLITSFNDVGEQLGSFPFKDPRIVQAESDYSGPSNYESIDVNIIIPYFSNIASANITNQDDLLEVDLSSFSGLPSDVSAATGGPYEVEEGDSILLDASGSTGDIVSYEWDINADGKSRSVRIGLAQKSQLL